MGCPCEESGTWQGPRRGESCGRPPRQAQLRTGNKRIKPFADGPSGSMQRRPPAVLPPPPFPSAPKAQSHCRCFHGAAPPSRRGGGASHSLVAIRAGCVFPSLPRRFPTAMSRGRATLPVHAPRNADQARIILEGGACGANTEGTEERRHGEFLDGTFVGGDCAPGK